MDCRLVRVAGTLLLFCVLSGFRGFSGDLWLVISAVVLFNFLSDLTLFLLAIPFLFCFVYTLIVLKRGQLFP